jgi:hypothetical protein
MGGGRNRDRASGLSAGAGAARAPIDVVGTCIQLINTGFTLSDSSNRPGGGLIHSAGGAGDARTTGLTQLTMLLSPVSGTPSQAPPERSNE